MITPVILCGGSGTRLWPLSRKLLPKQFLPLVSAHTMIQETVLRARRPRRVRRPAAGGRPGAALPRRRAAARDRRAARAHPARAGGPQHRARGRRRRARRAGRRPQALLLVLPSDHAIRDVAAFHAAVRRRARRPSPGAWSPSASRPPAPRRASATSRRASRWPGCPARAPSSASSKSPTPRPRAASSTPARYLLEQRHVRVRRGALPRGARPPPPRDPGGGARAPWQGAARDLDFLRLEREGLRRLARRARGHAR